MGEAIARFRELLLSAQRYADEYHSQPRATVTAEAAEKFAKDCRQNLHEHEKAGMVWPERYIRGLCRLRDKAENHLVDPPPGCIDMPEYIEWVPEPRGFYPPESEVFAALRKAVREGVRWGSLFPVVEARLKALEAAADMMIQYAATTHYSGPNPTNSGDCDDDYITYRVKFADALDALAPFIEEPPASEEIAEKKTGSNSRRGGRPQTDEDLARDLLDGWRAYEPEEGRKTKDRYLSQRPDVRVLKTEDARQRKIATMRVALDSALHLRREKTKQKKRLRG